MPFLPAEPHAQPTYQSMQFDGSAEDVAELVFASSSALSSKLLVRVSISGFQEGESPPQWRVTLVRPDGIEMVANPTSWIVVSSTGAIRVLEHDQYILEFAS